MSTPQYPPPPEDPSGRGSPQPGWEQPPPGGYDGYGGPPGPPKSNGPAIASLVCGIIALLASWIPGVNLLSVVLGIAAIITGVIGLRNADRRGGRGIAIGGLVTGVLGLLVAVVILVVIGTAITEFVNDPEMQEAFESELRRFESEGAFDTEG